MPSFISGAAKALVAGVIAGAGALAIYLGLDAELAAILGLILAPVAVYFTKNAAPQVEPVTRGNDDILGVDTLKRLG